jgi:hypothetical protein
MTGNEHFEVRFITSAEASVDARALANPTLARVDLLVDVIALGLAPVSLAVGYQILGVIVLVIALLSLLGRHSHPFQRAVISMRARSVLGRETRVTLDETGAHFESGLGTAFVPWSSVTDVRANHRTVALFRDRLLLGYVPASAFSSVDQQHEAVAFARSKVGLSS